MPHDNGCPILLWKGWYSSGSNPHRDLPGDCQFITFRLANSLPQHVLRALDFQVKKLPEPQQQRYKRQKIERWLDAGLGCCALAHPGMAAVMRDTLIYQNGRRYHLLAWCIMPNHVHALIEPARSLPRIVQGWSRILPAGCWRIMSGSGWACQGGVCGCGITGTASSGTSDIWKRLFIIFIRTRLRRGCARRLRNGVGRVRFGRRGRRRSA